MLRNVGLQRLTKVCRLTLFALRLDTDLVLLATVHLKRLPVLPREARVVKSTADNIETLHPIPYDTRI